MTSPCILHTQLFVDYADSFAPRQTWILTLMWLAIWLLHLNRLRYKNTDKHKGNTKTDIKTKIKANFQSLVYLTQAHSPPAMFQIKARILTVVVVVLVYGFDEIINSSTPFNSRWPISSICSRAKAKPNIFTPFSIDRFPDEVLVVGVAWCGDSLPSSTSIRRDDHIMMIWWSLGDIMMITLRYFDDHDGLIW